MAYCEVVDLPGGGTAVVRLTGKPPALCDVCSLRRHTALCDALVPAKRKTCDRKLCDTCRIRSGKNDFCPEHKDLA